MYFCIAGLCAGIALIAYSPNRSLLGLIGALLFAGSALMLAVLFALSLVRSVRSRTFHGRQLLAGLLLLLLALFIAQRFDGPSAETRIERVIDTAATTTDPAYCDQLTTERYLAQTTGEAAPFADETCESELDGGTADAVEVRDIAVDGDRATAVVAHTGGPIDGSQVLVRLIEENGRWKLDRALRFVHFDRGGFRRAYREKLRRFGSTPAALDCIFNRELRLPDESIEREVLEPDERIYAGLVVACDREAIERNLIDAIKAAPLELPEHAIECTKLRVASATDVELMRWQTDVAAYNRLVLACGRDAFLAFHRNYLSSEAGLRGDATECVIAFFETLPARRLVGLTYDEERYEALLDECESRG